LSSSYAVRTWRGRLRYDADTRSAESAICEQIEPTEAQWKAFRAALDRIDVWRWGRRYANPGICDGTQWEVLVAYADKKVRSSGDNNYPNDDGSPSGRPGGSRAFARFARAIKALLGGKEFG